MTASVDHFGQALGLGTRMAFVVTTCGLVGLVGVIALATRQDVVVIVLGIAALGVATLVGFKWPILCLGLFAALIPIEEIVVIDGFGTISRFAGILFAATYAIPRLGRLKPGAMPPPAWAYLAWAVASVGWALDAATAWEQILTLLQLFVIAFLVADFVVHRPETVRSVLWVYSLSASASAVIGIESFLTGGARAAVFQSQNPEHFAAALTPALLFGFDLAMHGSRRALGAAMALVTTIGVLVSGTRAAWVAVVFVVLLVMLPQLSPKRRFALAALALAFAVAAYQLPGVAALIDARVGTALSTGGAGRADIWSVAGTIYRSSPLVGVGYANFPVAYTPAMVRASDVVSWSTDVRGAHNFVLSTVVELGPIGLLALALFLGPLVLRRGWGREATTVQAMLTCLLVQASFVDMLSNRKPIWLVIGLAAGLAFVARREHAQGYVRGGLSASPSGAPEGIATTPRERLGARRMPPA